MINKFHTYYKCPICKTKTVRTSRPITVNKDTKINWISDSCYDLAGLKEATCELQTCQSCLHTFLLPIYDTSKLYQTNLGYETRKKAYESYNPKDVYGYSPKQDTTADKIFKKSARELKRFENNLKIFAQIFKSEKINYDSFSILDWGGGDGYISKIYSSVIKSVLNKEVDYYVYDISEWKNSQGVKQDLNEINKKFQLIIISHVLEHLHDPLNELKAALKYADKNCVVIIEVPDQRYVSLLGLLGKKYGLNYHVSFFCRKSLTRLMSSTGIKPIFSKYDFNSSYRGNGIESIIAVGRFNKQNQLTNNSEPNFLYEFFTTVFLFIRLALRKFAKI